MENQTVNGVLDLSLCMQPEGKLILPPGTEAKVVGSDVLERMRAKMPEPKVDNSSKIPPEEWDFNKAHGFNPPRAVGPRMVVQQYKHQLSEIIEITNATRSNQKWESNVGRLIGLGSACFKGDQFKDWSEEDKPKIGEWITYKVNAGPVTKFRGIDIIVMYDDAINMKIDDPEHVSRD